MKKNTILTIAATLIAITSRTTASTQSEVLFSYTNLSDQLAYVAIKGGLHPSDYMAINDTGWILPQASGDVRSNFSWIAQQQINKDSVVSTAFLTEHNEIVVCKENYPLNQVSKITLIKDEQGKLKCDAPSKPSTGVTSKELNIRFKYLSSFPNYALFIYDPADAKWKNLAFPNTKVGSYGEWIVISGLKPNFYSTELTNDSIVRIGVREEYTEQNEDYNEKLPITICGEVKFSGSYEFVFYEKGQHGNLSGCSSNQY
ncbi:MAG: hypothetical protein ACRC1U_03965 [Vibrionaceae bacterium]